MTEDLRLFKNAKTFNTFVQIVDNYTNETILDFGGNHGNLIKSSDGKIAPSDYTCMDVSEPGINALPDNVKSIHWNRHHPFYNPTGSCTEPFPNISEKYDLVFANSVFTHMPVTEIVYCLNNLLTVSDTVYFTYVDPTNKQFFDNARKFFTLKPMLVTDDDIDKMCSNDVSYIIDQQRVTSELEPNWEDMWIVIKTEYLKQVLHDNASCNIVISTGNTDWFNWMKIEKRVSIWTRIINFLLDKRIVI